MTTFAWFFESLDEYTSTAIGSLGTVGHLDGIFRSPPRQRVLIDQLQELSGSVGVGEISGQRGARR